MMIETFNAKTAIRAMLHPRNILSVNYMAQVAVQV
jgi:hypothetical protein